jgi:signal transduction histidine kinase
VKRRGRWGLRGRLTASFALGALLLSAALAAASFTATRSYLLSQRETSAVDRTLAQGQTLADGLRSTGAEPGDLLDGLRAAPDARLLLHLDGRWYGADVGEVQPVPAQLGREVEAGHASRQRVEVAGSHQLIVGVPLEGRNAQLYEVFSLDELDGTLRRTSRALALIALLTTAVGAAVGWATSRRLLRPLSDVITTSRSIADGRLSARLPDSRDPDVAPFVESFNAMTQALQDRIDRDARFAADVSHELRSPLTTLSAALSVLRGRRDELGGRGRAALDLLGNEVDRFAVLVQDLLEISRLDAGHPFDREPVGLARLVLTSPSLARLPDVSVEVDASVAGVTVAGDKRRLERVLANLLQNAVRYGGGVTAVRVTPGPDTRPDGTPTCVLVAVEDSGPGVPPEDRDRIFERFSRGSGGDRDGTRGVGLGLALVRDLVAAHDGEVWVEDRPGGGARFVVALPALGVDQDEPVPQPVRTAPP